MRLRFSGEDAAELLALTLAIGLLIDDAVVVREAITHRLEQGESPAEAASKGTKDVFLAVVATTFSLVAVFVPVAFMPGIVGQFFKQFGLPISAAVVTGIHSTPAKGRSLPGPLIRVTRAPRRAACSARA